MDSVGLRESGKSSVHHDKDLAWWLQEVKCRWPDTQVLTEGAFGMEWRKNTPNNGSLNYRFDARGTGAPGSEKELEIQWFMNQEFRLALLRNWKAGGPEMVSTSPGTTCLHRNRRDFSANGV